MKNILYNLIIEGATEHCYKNCLSYFPDRSDVLDVGIGNGTMLKKFHSVIKSKGLKITGVDINKVYIDHCDHLIRTFRLEDHIQINYDSIESYEPPQNKSFDFILFSMSFMLFKDRQLVLDKIRDYMKPGGKIVFFQTMFKEKFRLMEFIKPKLKYVTTVDFGRVTYENEFFDLLDRNSLSISRDLLIKKEWFRGEYRMIIASTENGKK
jgi:SAM-dependent methyltransferase